MNTQSPPTTLSDERLMELKELYSKATRGTWRLNQNQSFQDIVLGPDYPILRCREQYTGKDEDLANAALVVSLHNDFPSLLHAAEQMAAQREEIKRLKDAFDKIWELGEMGYLTTDYLPDVECGECGAKAKSRDAIIHEDHCIQGVIAAALLPPAPEKQEGGVA